MKISRTIFAGLAVVMTVGSVAPAMAASYTSCKMMEAVASSGDLAKHCHKYIVGQGLITKGKHKNEKWEDVFSSTNFRALSDKAVTVKYGDDVHGDLHYNVPQRLIWKVNGKDSIETKEIGLDDVDDYLNGIFGKDPAVDGKNAGRQLLYKLKHPPVVEKMYPLR